MMTALELYQEDQRQRSEPYKRRSRMEYFMQLRDTLCGELSGEGRSDFLDEMIAGCSGGKALQALEFAALRECFAFIVDGRPMKDVSVHVPHLLRGDQPLTWMDMENGKAFRVNDPEMPEMLLRLRNVSWQLVSARDQTPAVEAERAVSMEIAALRAINHALEENNRNLREENDKLTSRVTELEEGFVSRQLQNKLDARRYQMEAELTREMEEKRRVAEEDIRQLFARAAADEQRAREDARREAAEADARRASGYDALQTALQAALAQQLADAALSLRGADLRFLAQCYATLSGVTAREMQALLDQAPAHGADEALLRRLTGMSGTLHAQLDRMEQALLQLGLQVYQPRVGEAFDSALHSPANAGAGDAPESEREIAAVETPGLRLIHADGQGEALVRAVVHTRRRADAEEQG